MTSAEPSFNHSTCQTPAPEACTGLLRGLGLLRNGGLSLVFLYLTHMDSLILPSAIPQDRLGAAGREERIRQASGGGNYFSP